MLRFFKPKNGSEQTEISFSDYWMEPTRFKEYGDDGWELMQIIKTEHKTIYYFKRQKA